MTDQHSQSRAAFAKRVRYSHGWAYESIGDDECCELESRDWLLWDIAWQASRKAALGKACERIKGVAESNELVGNTQGTMAADDCLTAIEGLIQ